MLPKISPTKMLDQIILIILVRRGPIHGYAISAIMEEKSGWKPSQTAIYNSLKSMENENLIVAEERIEKGRAQKIYSLTDKGQKHYEQTHQIMRKQMMKNFTQFFSLAQMISEIDNEEESETLQDSIQSIIDNMQESVQLLPLVIREAPKETKAVIENTIQSLRKIAVKYNIELEEQ